MRPGRAADHSPPSSAAVMEQYSYTPTHPLRHTGPVTGTLYLYLYFYLSTFRSMCAALNVAVFCSSLISCIPGMLLRYCLRDYEVVLK